LVIGVEKLSDVTDYTDRSTCVLFGDGAGAVVLKRSFQIKNLLPKVLKKYFMPIGILATYQKSDGSHKDKLWCTNEKDNSHFLKMEGNHLFKLAVNLMIEAADKVLSKVKISSKKIDLLFPHQANDRIIMAVAERLKLEEKVVSIISKIGNISSATIPIALDQYNRQGKLKKGGLYLFDAFGAGLTWGAVLIKWQKGPLALKLRRGKGGEKHE